MHRILAIGLVSALVLVGALHYAPLWIFVLVTPMWLALYLSSEERRVRAETVRQVREHMLDTPRSEQE